MKARILLVALAGLFAFPGFGQHVKVPAELKVPKGSRLVQHVYGKGIQLYTCLPSPKDSSVYVWTSQGAQALLYSDKDYRQAVGNHYFNEDHKPVWEALDQSKVVGNKLQQADAPDPNAVPWLLLQSISSPDAGRFKAVILIQRINTRGGKAPDTGADASHKGQSIHVEYTAEYLFYAAN